LIYAPPLEITTLERLLARKQQLVERLQRDPGPHERNEIERLLAEIDQALNLIDPDGSGQQ
jgi:hypothetical protein